MMDWTHPEKDLWLHWDGYVTRQRIEDEGEIHVGYYAHGQDGRLLGKTHCLTEAREMVCPTVTATDESE